MMTAGEIIDMACSEAGMTDDESRAFALTQVDKWHRHICQQELWRELVGVYGLNSLNGFSTNGSYALPYGIDRVLSVRTLARTLLNRNITEFFQQEPWEFEREGSQVSFTLLSPCIDRLVVDYAVAANSNGVDRDNTIGLPAIYYPNGLNGGTNVGYSARITYRDNNNNIYTASAAISTLIQANAYYLEIQGTGLSSQCREIIAFTQSPTTYPVRVFLYSATYAPISAFMQNGALILGGETSAKPRKWIHIAKAPDTISDDSKSLRLLVKREAKPLSDEGFYPDITGCENALTAFVKSALLRMDKRGDEANEALQEANALLAQLKQVAVVQEANHQQLIPADGMGSDWNGNPELFHSFKV